MSQKFTADFYSFRLLGSFIPLTMMTSCLTALTLPRAHCGEEVEAPSS
ncbi:MAG: hypothetical protein ACHQ9S_25855 [Candidatus Binatia bacterium]